MELPFLKNSRKNHGGGGPLPQQKVDSISGDHLLSLITDELHDALSKKDHKGAMDSLRAFVLHVKDEDKK